MTFLGTYRISIIRETCHEKNIFGFYILCCFCIFESFLFLYFVFVGFSNFVFCFSKIFTAKLFEIKFKKIREDFLTLRELGFAFQFDELSYQTALLGGL